MSAASIQLEEEIEGDQIGSKNYRFSRIGTPVPIKSGEDSSFDIENECPPLQPLVVSERFRLLFVAHSNGFCVARTKEVMASAEEIKEKGTGPSIQQLSVVDVTIGKISLLALSGDDSLLAACVANTIHFFPVSALLYKDQTPAFSHILNDSSIIKDMQWAKKAEKVYAVLSSDGKLYSGVGQSPVKEVMDDADAFGWSPDGEFIAITRKNLVSILTSKFEEKFSILLSFKSLLDDSNVKYIIKVDVVRWIRPDCIIIGCLQVNDDNEEEENYAVQVITSVNGRITHPSAKPVVRSFRDVFLDFRYDAVPPCSGPHLFSSYLDQYQLAFVANRKNLDQHILLFGWSVGDAKNEAAIIEILNDNWSPKIEAQDSGDDILILGLAIDKVSQNGEIKLLLGEEEKEVSPCCLLLCLTNDGRLSIFHFASATAASVSPQSTEFEEKNDTSIVASSQDLLVESSGARKQLNQVDSGLQPHEIDKGHKILSTSAQSSAAEKFSSEEVIKTTNQNQGANLEQSASKTFVPVDAGGVNNFRTQETEKVAEVKPGTISFSGSSLGNFSIRSIGPSSGTGGVMELPVKTMSTGLTTASSHSSKLHISSKSDETLSSTPFSGVPRRHFDSSDKNSSSANEKAGTSVSIGSYKPRAMAGAGSTESLPAFPGSRLQSQKGFQSEPSKLHFTRETCEGIPLKQFHDVEEMARKLDSLLEGIEGEGGFRDASISAHRSSVLALEEGIESVSEKCRIWRAVMDKQLGEVQLLLDKTIQVFKKATKIHSYISQRPLLLNLMRKFTNERNLVKPAKTRFATAYLTMRVMYNQKKNLRMLILSTEWTSSRFAKETLGKDVANLLISAHFWNDVVRALKVCGPLTTVLRLVDGERKPPMGYIYEAMDRAKEAIAQAFGRVKRQYEKVFEIIDARWTDQLHRPLHAAGFILNPGLFYKAHNDGTIHQNVWPGYHACVEKMNPDITTQDLLVAELPRYKNAEGLFGCGQAQRAKDTRSPVLARKVYMEGIFKQATDERYWDLWNRQKLCSELELKRQHINEVNKSLTSQLIELERHFNTLELNKFGDTGGIQTSKRGFQSRPGQPRHSKSLHNLRNTMTTQLAVAEQLSESLSKLMTDLSIDSPAKGQSVRKELFETIGLSYDGASYKSPAREKADNTPFNKELSVFLAVKERSRRKKPSPVKSSEPETARRRRDSLDRNWASFETPKTTVKRIVLHEDRQKETSDRSSLSLDKKHHQSKTRERSATAELSIFNASSTSPQQVRSNKYAEYGLPRHAAETPPMSSPVSLPQHESQLTSVTGQYGLVDTHNLATTRSSRSTIPLKDILQTGGPEAIQQSGNRMQQPNSSSPPAQTLTPIKFRIETSNADGKPGITKPVGDWKNAPVTSGSTQFESNSSPNYSLPTAAAANSAFTLSAKVIHSEVVNKSQVSEISLSSQESTHSSSSQANIMPLASLSSSQEPMLSPISSTWTSFESISKATMASNQKVSQSSEASLTQSSSLPSTQKLESLRITPSSDSTRSESPTILSRPSVAILDRKADKNSDRPPSLANLSTKIDTPQDSASQPVVSFSVSNLQAGSLVPSNSTNEQSASLKSASQANPCGESSQISNVGLNSIPGQEFSASSIPPSVKSGGSDVVAHEDEMEEEAPENNQMTENALGNLAGFGIGTSATPVSTKPNPFGATSLNKASSPANSLFTSTASGSELFRPASFSFQPIQPPQPSPPANFGAFGSFSLTSTSQAPAVSGFGQPAQVGQGQHALGSVLGTFGQSRQLGAGLPGTGVGSASSFGGGFMSNSTAGGFGGGFAGVSSAGGGFASLGSGGVGFGASAAPSGGFAAAASGAGGFGASAAPSGGFAAAASGAGGFAAAATSAGGFAAAATPAGGFGAAAAPGGGFAAPTAVGSGFSGGGFGAFSSQQSGGSGFPAFGGSSSTARPPSQLFTQMRK